MIDRRLIEPASVQIVIAKTLLIRTVKLMNLEPARDDSLHYFPSSCGAPASSTYVGACVSIFVRGIRAFWFLDSLKVKGKRNDVADNVARTSTATRRSAAVAATRGRLESNLVTAFAFGIPCNSRALCPSSQPLLSGNHGFWRSKSASCSSSHESTALFFSLLGVLH